MSAGSNTRPGSDFESDFLLYRLLHSDFPKTYSDRLRLRFAPLVKLHLDNEYPRASITTRLGRLEGKLPLLRAVSFAQRRRSSPMTRWTFSRCVAASTTCIPTRLFPGCIYSEMKMCLAPCFKGCSDDEYRNEVARVQTYFDSAGDSLLQEMSSQRDQASTSLEFENASALHARVEKLKPVLSQLPEIVHRIDRLTAVMVQHSPSPGCVTLFRVDGRCVSGPLSFAIQSTEHTKSQSMESRVQEALATLPSAGTVNALEPWSIWRC